MCKKRAIILIFIFFFVAGIDNKLEAKISTSKEWTILYYYNADNNMWRKFYQIMDQFKHSVTSDNINVVIQQDGPFLGDGIRKYLKYSPKGEDLGIVYEQGVEYDMGSETTLAAFVKWGLDNFPAKRTILVVNGHGAGIVNFCTVGSFLNSRVNSLASSIDDTSGSYFSDKKLRKELKKVLGNRKLDLFVYNSCYMGGIEVVHELSQIAEYAVASEDHIILAKGNMFQEEEVNRGIGIPVHLLPTFVDNDREVSTEEVAKFLVKEYGISYNNFQGTFEKLQYTLAAYDLSKTSEVSHLYNKMIQEFNQLSSKDPTFYSNFYREFLSLPKLQVIGYLDLGLVAKAVYNSSRLKSAADLIRYLYSGDFIIDKTIINSDNNLAGISIFIPYDFYFYLDKNLTNGIVEYFEISWISKSHKSFISNYLEHIRNNKEDILVDMIMNYLTTGVIEVFRFNDTQTNLFHLLRTLEGLVAVYPEVKKKSFFKKYYNLIKDYNNEGAHFEKHKKYAREMAK
jgi:hypothetical protein